MTEGSKQNPVSSSYLRRYGIDSIWAHLALCLASAVMLTLAFPKPGWPGMAFFAPVPVGVLAMRSTRLRRLGWTSFLVFTVWWTLRLGWLRHVDMVAPLGVAMVMGLYMAVMLVLLARVQHRYRGAMTLTLPIFWCAQEALRSVWPWGGFAWFSLGSSQAAWQPGQGLAFPSGYLVQSADLLGVVTVSFLIAMTAGLMVDLISRPIVFRGERGRTRIRRTIVIAGGLWLLCMTGSLVYGWQRIKQWPDATTPGPVLAVVQTNVPQSNKIDSSDPALPAKRKADWDRLFELSDIAVAQTPRPDLIVWPETMVLKPINDEYVAWADGWLELAGQLAEENRALVDDDAQVQLDLAREDRAYRTRIADYARVNGVPLIVGGRAALVYPDDTRSMNSAFYVQPDSDSFERYSKQQLVPFGEYIPGPAWLKDRFLSSLSPYDYDYTLRPGEGPVAFELTLDSHREGPIRIATPICFEDVVGEVCREMVYTPSGKKRMDVLVNLTNDGWFPNSHEGEQHMQLAALRCIESRVPMARSVNTGPSGFIDSLGRIGEVVRGAEGQQQDTDGVASAQVMLDRRATLYGRFGHAGPVGVWIAAAMLVLGTLMPRRRDRGRG